MSFPLQLLVGAGASVNRDPLSTRVKSWFILPQRLRNPHRSSWNKLSQGVSGTSGEKLEIKSELERDKNITKGPREKNRKTDKCYD